jgi:hypothetical protein
MSHKPDWDAYAVRQADQARALRVILRGVVPGGLYQEQGPLVLKQDAAGQLALCPDVRGLGIAVIHGNDGFLQDPRVRAEVHVLRQILARQGIEVLGFGTDTRKRTTGRAWALVVRSDDVHLLHRCLEAAHAHVFFRSPIARRAAAMFFAGLELDPEDFPFDLDAFAG